MSNDIIEALIAFAAAFCAAVVIGLSVAGAGTAALYVTAFGATAIVCGLEYLRKLRGVPG